jgi:O-antigen/teichoic acid export membrane protein
MTGGELAQALFRGRSRFGMYNGLTLLADYGELVAVVVAVVLGYGLVGALVAFLVARVATMVVSLALAATRIGIAAPRRADMRKYAAYSLPLMPEQLLLWVIHVSDRYLMGHFWGNADVGRYSAAYSLAGVVGLVAGPVMVVLFPLIARFYDRGEHAKARLYLEQTARYLLLVTVPLALVLAALSREALRLFAGDEFVGAAVFIPFIAVGLMLHRFQGLYTYVLMAAQRTRAIMWVHGVAALANITANAILMPRIGPVAAAYTTLGTYALGAVCMWALSRRSLPITVSAAFVGKTVVSSVAVAALVMLVEPRGAAACIGACAGAAAAYLGIMLLMRGVTLDELRKLVALLFRRRAGE